MDIGNQLTELRKSHGLTQNQLATELQVSRQTVYRWEHGTALPSMDNLRRLSQLYKVPLDFFTYEGVELESYHDQPETTSLDVITLEHDHSAQSEFLDKKIDKRKRRFNKKIFIAVLGLLLVLAVGISIYCITYKDSTKNSTQLEQLGKEKVTISSGNGFDLQ